jgi:glucose/mannose-6-phosphate isomerase
MINLDSIDEIKKIDSENVLGSVEDLPGQVKHAWEEANNVVVPESFKEYKNIIMCGMGGSGLGARIIESVYQPVLKFPLIRINDYNLPTYANENSLVMCSSYSGTTEETVNNALQAIEKGCKWMAIGTGNELEELARANNAPFYKIDAKYNPSNQPRMAIGYSVIGQIVLASKAAVFDIASGEIESSIATMERIKTTCGQSIPEADNPAKKLAQMLMNKDVEFVSSEHMVGASHTVNNQLNENAKVFSADYVIPELNHHLMEGLKHPEKNRENLFIVFVNSDIYSKRIAQRMKITEDVVQKNNIQTYVYTVNSETKLTQSFEFIQFGAYVNLYLAILYEQNPAPIPWVDYFKDQLGQPLGK